MRGRTLEERLDAGIVVQGECWVYQYGQTGDGYGRLQIKGRKYMVHRLVYELVTGTKIPEGMVVNHLCGVRSCCRPQHLQLATVQENNQYLTALRATNTSGYRGVRWHPRSRKWYASVRVDGKAWHLGSFDTAEEANVAAIAGRAKYHSVPEFTDVVARLAA